jgi:hypothetical protein
MSSVVISGDTSGAVTLAAPAVAGTNTLTLPAATGTVLTTATTGMCKAWVNFSGTTINGSYNIASVTNPGTGTFTITFTTAMSNTNYCPQISCSFASGIREDVFGVVYNDSPYTPTTTSFTVKFYRADTNAAVNPTFGYVAVFG